MKKLFLLLAVVVASVTVVSAQNYKSGIGLRLTYNLSIDYKWNVSEKNSWEFNLSFPAFLGVEGTAAYQWNFPFSQKGDGSGFNAYVGPAAGIGYLGGWSWGGVMIGVGAHAGVEYKFTGPFALGIDYKPMFTYVLGKYTKGIWFGGLYDFALVARYTF